MNVVQRVQAPTPKFFKKLRNIGLSMVAIAATILTAPVGLPAIILKIAGYLAVAGGVAGAISQTAAKSEQ
jgi:uncharacterized transporter YbjL